MSETAILAEKPKLCLTDAVSHTMLIDYTKLFDHKMYSMNTNLGNNNEAYFDNDFETFFFSS